MPVNQLKQKFPKIFVFQSQRHGRANAIRKQAEGAVNQKGAANRGPNCLRMARLLNHSSNRITGAY